MVTFSSKNLKVVRKKCENRIRSLNAKHETLHRSNFSFSRYLILHCLALRNSLNNVDNRYPGYWLYPVFCRKATNLIFLHWSRIKSDLNALMFCAVELPPSNYTKQRQISPCTLNNIRHERFSYCNLNVKLINLNSRKIIVIHQID